MNGIDISQWQGQPDFGRLKFSQQFVFIRSSYGDGYTDPQFARNRDQCRNNNTLHGFYHYAYPQYNTPEAEAAWFLKVCSDIQDGEVMVLDFEEHYAGDVVDWCKRFLDYIQVHLHNYKPLIYLNLSQTHSYNWKPLIDEGYGLWLAYYDQNPNSSNWDTPWPFVALRQWSSSQRYDGINGYVDADVFYGTPAQFLKYGYTKPVTPPSPPNYQQIATAVKVEVNSSDSDATARQKIHNLTANI